MAKLDFQKSLLHSFMNRKCKSSIYLNRCFFQCLKKIVIIGENISLKCSILRGFIHSGHPDFILLWALSFSNKFGQGLVGPVAHFRSNLSYST